MQNFSSQEPAALPHPQQDTIQMNRTRRYPFLAIQGQAEGDRVVGDTLQNFSSFDLATLLHPQLDKIQMNKTAKHPFLWVDPILRSKTDYPNQILPLVVNFLPLTPTQEWKTIKVKNR